MIINSYVLTHEPERHRRTASLQFTVEDMAKFSDTVTVIWNDDRTRVPEWAERSDSSNIYNLLLPGRLHTSAAGNNAVYQAYGNYLRGGLILFSDDDIVWPADTGEKLEAWYDSLESTNLDEQIVLTGCHLEPEFPWNPIRGKVDTPGVKALYRNTVGAASWAIRDTDLHKVFPIPQWVQGAGDVMACESLQRRYPNSIAQLDIADVPPTNSTWGNKTLDMYGWDVESVREKLNG